MESAPRYQTRAQERGLLVLGHEKSLQAEDSSGTEGAVARSTLSTFAEKGFYC